MNQMVRILALTLLLVVVKPVSLKAQGLKTLNSQIQNAIASNDFDQAEKMIDFGLKVATEKYADQPVLTAFFLSQKGALYQKSQRASKAVFILNEALAIYDHYPNDPGQIATLITAGDTYLDMDQPGEALQFFDKANKLLTTNFNGQYKELDAAINNGLGGVYGRLNDPEQSLIFFRKAISYYKKAAHPGYISAVLNMVPELGILGYTDEILAEITDAEAFIAHWFEGKHPSLWRLKTDRGQAYVRLGKHQMADISFKTSLALAKAQFGPTSMPVAIVHNMIASLYRQDSTTYTRSAEHRLEALRITKEIGLAKDILVARSENDLSSLYMTMGKHKLVAPLLSEAIDIVQHIQAKNFGFISEKQKELYAKDGALIFNNTISFTSSIIEHDEDSLMQQLSYNAALYMNGLLLDDARQLRNVIRKSGDTSLVRLYNQSVDLKRQIIGSSTQQQTTLSAEVDLVERQLARLSSVYNDLRVRTQLDWKHIQRKLAPAQASVTFVRYNAYIATANYNGDSILYAAMVIRPGYTYPRFVRLGKESQLRQLLADSETPTALYTSRGPRFGTITYGDSLYRLVWQPIEKLVEGVNRVYFSADGLLHRVAFAAIPLPGTTAKTPASKRYLNSRHELYQLFSTRQIAQGIRPLRWQSGMSVALLGGIRYEPAGTSASGNNKDAKESDTYLQKAIQTSNLIPFPYLDATRQEVTAIHRLLPQSVLTIGTDASEKRFRQFSGNSPAILHLATHGLFIPAESENKSPGGIDKALMRSGLAMAGANRLWQTGTQLPEGDDGVLTAYEVADQDLSQTRLVVLSACETALGDLRGAEGVFGLQRSFRLAGVEKLLMSLWPVDDIRTQQLMTFFYTYLKAGQDVRSAFKTAQLDMQKQVDDPTIWAAFVLVE
ncbi:CHAT domain-containing tetratricopeptide repeat protein [Fibrella forsythiae]|uniref:CHAT domain-containing protein n=1 Tax=Fibrella forsythiae TaxID=2817061 RepID=A0ABS3JHZ3_9BACT|nr:CHAT domain-containing protein [Fibrella forsythiae]MBO0949631.1 CHAT domain-containing protein [Fibrella forsythiae]